MGAVISLEHVAKRFVIQRERTKSFQQALVNLITQRGGANEDYWALKDVSFDVQPGETLGLIGENGAGKSTILKLITRILQPTSGRIAVNGKISALIELGAGFHPDLTGRENIFLNGSILGIGRREMRRKVDEIVAFSELERFIDTPVKHYSSGMYMRLGFAVAFSVEPDVLIVDEVLAVGDEAFQRKCLERIGSFRRQGKTILFVSHSLEVVESLCDRVIWLHGGVVREQGSASHMIRAYQAELRRRESGQREAARQLAQDQPRAIVPSPAGSVEFGEADLRDADGVERYSFETSSTLVARLRYRVPIGEETDWRAGFELRRSDGLLIYGTSFDEPLPPTDEAGWRALDVTFPQLPLLAGSFELAPTLRRVVADETQPERGPACGFSVWGASDEAGLAAIASCRGPIGRMAASMPATARVAT